MHIAYIGLGSNMGDKVGNINKAIAALGKISGNKVLAVSSFYETEPVGDIDQDWFINAAVKIDTGLTPRELLEILLKIEKELGRVRDARWGPRTIDLDILLYDDLALNEEGLVIPHPYLHERRFVLAPLAEIAPGLIHPRLKNSMSELLKGLHDSKKIKKVRRTKV